MQPNKRYYILYSTDFALPILFPLTTLLENLGEWVETLPLWIKSYLKIWIVGCLFPLSTYPSDPGTIIYSD